MTFRLQAGRFHGVLAGCPVEQAVAEFTSRRLTWEMRTLC
jgi:hypothetical protein